MLTVGKENAERFGVCGRYSLHGGSALEVPFGEGFDVLLAAKLLNRWERETIETLLKQAHAALAPKGQVVVVEFAPNDDRVSPPLPASFVMDMFANARGGDAYTVSEHIELLRNTGFAAREAHALHPTPQTGIVGTKL